FVRPGEAAPFRLALQDRWGNACRELGANAKARPVVVNSIASLTANVIARDAEGTTVYQREHAFPTQGFATLALDDLPTDRGTLHIVADVPGRPEIRAAVAWLTVDATLPSPRALYADLHVHAHDTVGTNSPAYNAQYARDIGGIDILGYTANDFQITDANWQLGVEAVDQFNEPGRFVVYPVQEWCGSS
ncbi:hypothetical protein ACLFKS_41375, partial [Paraburkholderia sp. BR10879]